MATGQRSLAGTGVLIAGPTASGKTALALHVAAKLDNPLIVNCDSMQIYRDLNIVTARPDGHELAQAEHALYGHRDGAQAYSVACWRDEVADLMVANPGRDCVFVGGTGLYFKVLLDGISPVPKVPEAIRHDVRERVEREGSVAVHAQLDKAMADQLSPADGQRVARAMEVLLATGRSLADWQSMPADGGLIAFDPTCSVVLDPPRDWLEQRIRVRTQRMFDPNSVAEVEALLARTLSKELPVMRAIGVLAIGAYLQGDMELEEARETLVVQTRRYAKRQQTWFRGQMTTWPRWDPSQGLPEVLAEKLVQSFAQVKHAHT